MILPSQKELDLLIAGMDDTLIKLRKLSEQLIHLRKIVGESFSPDTIIDIACLVFDVDKKKVVNDHRTRKNTIVTVRYLCIVEIKNRFPYLNMDQVASYFSMRHSVYYHASRKIADIPAYETGILAKIKEVRTILDDICVSS